MRRRGRPIGKATAGVVAGFVLLIVALLLLWLLFIPVLRDGSLEENFALAQSHGRGKVLLVGRCDSRVS